MEDTLKFLKELQMELKTQDNDAQASPRFWTVGDYRMVNCAEGFEDDFVINLPELDFSGSLEEIKELITDRTEEGDEELQEYVEEHGELKDWEEDVVLDYLRDNVDNSVSVITVREEHFVVENTMFITKEEARLHIKQNSHHYSPRVHTYAMTAYRASKVERLWEILENFDWDSIK